MDPRQRLEQLEKESKQWRKHYEDEERRINKEYERREAEIDAEFKEAKRKIQLEFRLKREAVIKQYRDDNSCQKNVCHNSSSQGACNINQQISAPTFYREISAHQLISIKISVEQNTNTSSLHGIRVSVARHVPFVSNGHGRFRRLRYTDYRNKNISKICTTGMYVLERQPTIKFLLCGTLCGTVMLTKEKVCAIFDPGGSCVYSRRSVFFHSGSDAHCDDATFCAVRLLEINESFHANTVAKLISLVTIFTGGSMLW